MPAGIGSPVSTVRYASASSVTGAPLVARAATAIPSIAAASKAGAERDAKIASAVTRPAASSRLTVSRRERAQAAGAREGLDPGVVRRLDVLAVERHQRSLGEIGGSGAARVPLRHDDAEAGGATALQYLRRPRPPAAGRGRGRRPAGGRGAPRVADRRQSRCGDHAHPRPRRGARARVRALGGTASARCPPDGRSGCQHDRARGTRVRPRPPGAVVLHDVLLRRLWQGGARRRSRSRRRRSRAA